MPRNLGPHVRSAAALTSLAVAAGLTFTLAPPATSATTPQVAGFQITGKQAKVRTSKGKRVTVTVVGGRNVFGGGRVAVPGVRTAAPRMVGDMSALYLTVSRAGEQHTWSLPIPNSALALKLSGKGRITPKATKTSPWAKVNLTVAPKGAASTTRCDGQTIYKSQRIRLTGRFWLDTRSGRHGWGTIGSKTKQFTFRTSATAMWFFKNTSSGCYHAPTTPCATHQVWNVYNSAISLFGDNRTMSGLRSVQLPKPKGAVRSDSVMATVSPVLTQDTAAGTARLTINGNGHSVTGSARIDASGLNTDQSQTCGTAGGHLQSFIWGTSTYTNGSSPLTLHDIYGKITAPNGANSYLTLTKPAPAPAP